MNSYTLCGGKPIRKQELQICGVHWKWSLHSPCAPFNACIAGVVALFALTPARVHWIFSYISKQDVRINWPIINLHTLEVRAFKRGCWMCKLFQVVPPLIVCIHTLAINFCLCDIACTCTWCSNCLIAEYRYLILHTRALIYFACSIQYTLAR